MKNSFNISTLALILVMAWPSFGKAEPLSGIFNTGVSDVDEIDNTTLDIRFHPCKEDFALTCGTVERVVNPDPEATDVMPDGSPIVGFTMITGLVDKGKGRYRGGKINAVDESISKNKMIWYGLKVDKQSDNSLKAKGCLGPICPRTMIWKAADETALE